MANYEAIETKFNGIRYRSKNEAKWACFFWYSNIKFEYEIQSFSGWKGDKYRPDFYLSEYDKYVEVKSSYQAIHTEEMENKLESMIDYNASPISRGLLLLGSFPYDVRIEGGLYLETDWLWWDEGVVSGTAQIGCVNNDVKIKFYDAIKDCGSPIPKSVSPDIRLKQGGNTYRKNTNLYEIINAVNKYHFEEV